MKGSGQLAVQYSGRLTRCCGAVECRCGGVQVRQSARQSAGAEKVQVDPLLGEIAPSPAVILYC
jgi:hypothetical protein